MPKSFNPLVSFSHEATGASNREPWHALDQKKVRPLNIGRQPCDGGWRTIEAEHMAPTNLQCSLSVFLVLIILRDRA